jgi:hypothetical protein
MSISRPALSIALLTACVMSGSAATLMSATRPFGSRAPSKLASIIRIAAISISIFAANGPTQSSDVSAGKTPSRLTRPHVGFSP